MELNHRFLGVGQVSWPLDHGTVTGGVTGSRTRISSRVDGQVPEGTPTTPLRTVLAAFTAYGSPDTDYVRRATKS